MHNPLHVMKIRSNLSRTSFDKELSQTHNVFGRGVRIDSHTHHPRNHSGWDLVAKEGTPVFAVMSGTVVAAKRDKSNGPKSYGYQVEIEFQFNGKTYRAFYAHLSEFTVWRGDSVSDGQAIGWTGHTGNAHNLSRNQWHLHFELRLVHAGKHDHLSHNSVDPAILLGGSILTCQ